MVVRDRRIREAVEFRETVHILPDLPVVRVENMCTVLVHMDFLNIAAVHIASDVRPLVDDKNLLPRGLRLMCEYAPVQSGTYNQIIIFHFFPP